MSKKVLITGITGMAGSHLAEMFLRDQPHFQIYGTKRYRSSLANIAHIQDSLQLIDCNLTDANNTLTVIESIRPDYIFHLAAHSFVADSWRCPQATLIDNTVMQLNIFEAMRHAKVDAVIQVALSSEQYGNGITGETGINESMPFQPLSPYAVSKVTQDMLAYQYYQSYGLKVIRTRAFNHDGPRRGEMFATSNFAKQIAEAEAGLRPPVVYVGNLTASRDFSDVRDIVRAYWLSAQYGTPGEDYIIASGMSRTIREMLDYLLSQSKIKIEIKSDPSRQRPSDVQLLKGDSSKFRKLTGWQPQYSFEQTMTDLLNWWRAQIGKTSDSKVASS